MSDLLLGTSRPLLPKVNLLPREIAARRQFRRVQMLLRLVVLAALGLAGAGYYLAGVSVQHAEQGLAQARTETATVNAQLAKYADVPRVEAELAAARTQLEQALGGEVRWSYRLNDLALTMPKRVWLTSITVQPGVVSVSPTAGAAGSPPIAMISIAGTAYSHDDVAAWLDALAAIRDPRTGRPIYSSVFLGTDREVRIGQRTAIAFDSSALVTADALSQRYTPRVVQP